MLDRRDVILAACGFAAMPLGMAASQVQDAGRVNTLGSPDRVAIRGYDPVAYFRDGGPREGKAAFQASYGGAVWRFASAEHKALFEADPERYTPAYGGFCAYGVSRGYLVKIEPEAWSIVAGRLYLNYDRGVQKSWLASTKAYIARADTNWPALSPGDGR